MKNTISINKNIKIKYLKYAKYNLKININKIILILK
jgi:hypothetical protein